MAPDTRATEVAAGTRGPTGLAVSAVSLIQHAMEIALDRAAAGAEMGADRPRFELREQRLGPGRHLEREVLALQRRTRLSGCAVGTSGGREPTDPVAAWSLRRAIQCYYVPVASITE